MSMLLNPYLVQPPVIPPTVAFVGAVLGAATGSATKSFTGVSVGGAVSKRVYFVMSWEERTGSTSVVSATVGGVAATVLGTRVGAALLHSFTVFAIDMGTATTADVAVALSSTTESFGDRKAYLAVYTVSGQEAALASARYETQGANQTSSAGDTVNTTIGVLYGGFCLAMAGTVGGCGAQMNFASVTEDASATYEVVGSAQAVTSTILNISVGWTPSSTASIAAFSFKP